MRATARVERRLCLGTGLCQAMDPDLFSLTDDGYGVALPPRNDSDDRAERLREIAECCPAGAITVTAE